MAAAVALAVTASWLLVRGTGQAPPAAPAGDPRPTVAVALGDSFASGEAAGSYARAPDGSADACHRSTVAQLRRAELPGIDEVVNLACSGATTANIQLDGQGLHGQPPQAAQLRPVAADYNVELVVVTVGANDLGWGELLFDCVVSLLPAARDCQETWAPRLPGLTGQVAGRIREAVDDVRAVLRAAGQDDGDYQLVLQSYASPVPREPRPMPLVEQVAAGCPVPADAMAWTNDELMPQLSEMVADAAAATGARFLDLRHAFDGHEVCAAGTTADTQWVAGLMLDPQLIGTQLFGGQGLGGAGSSGGEGSPGGRGSGDPAETALREALHPNARGHAQLGRCLSQFYAAETGQAACAAAGDGARVR